MKFKITGVGGSPATGKSTLIKALIDCVKSPWNENYKSTLKWHENSTHKLIVLGDYSNKQGNFGGTDRLSMAVQPVALKAVQDWSVDPTRQGWSVLFEGDRLFNLSFISSVNGMAGVESKWIILEVSAPVTDEASILDKRHTDRGDTQSKTWLRGRETKINKIRVSLSGIQVWRHNTPEDTQTCLLKLKNLLGLSAKEESD